MEFLVFLSTLSEITTIVEIIAEFVFELQYAFLTVYGNYGTE